MAVLNVHTWFSSGGSCSNMVLLDGNGSVVGRSEGLGTNHWVGITQIK